jgi:hypothetical protein
LVELSAEREMGESGWEMVYWLVEVIWESEMGEIGWKSIDTIINFCSTEEKSQ